MDNLSLEQLIRRWLGDYKCCGDVRLSVANLCIDAAVMARIKGDDKFFTVHIAEVYDDHIIIYTGAIDRGFGISGEHPITIYAADPEFFNKLKRQLDIIVNQVEVALQSMLDRMYGINKVYGRKKKE